MIFVRGERVISRNDGMMVYESMVFDVRSVQNKYWGRGKDMRRAVMYLPNRRARDTDGVVSAIAENEGENAVDNIWKSCTAVCMSDQVPDDSYRGKDSFHRTEVQGVKIILRII